MIAHITGKLIHKTPDSVIVDVNGVGYEIIIPLSTFYNLAEINDNVSLRIHMHHRDDAIQLYGFLSAEEKTVFSLLIGVSGVGPRLARNILSGIDVLDLVSAISTSDRARLNSIPGVGAKSAERLILELKDKVGVVGSAEAPAAASPDARSENVLADDVASALENLGYKPAKAEAAVKKAVAELAEGEGAGEADEGTDAFEHLFKAALKALSKG